MSELVVSAAPDAPEPSIEGLARLLVAFERSLTQARPIKLVLADDSDDALAAALVGAKLRIELEPAAQAVEAPTRNAALIAQLAGG